MSMFRLQHVFSVGSVDHIKRSVRGPIATEPISAPRDVALICFTSGKSPNFVADFLLQSVPSLK